MVLVDINNNNQDGKGRLYRVSVYVAETDDLVKYPEGVKAIFRLFRLNHEGSEELVILLDNHEPFGFHEHDELPGKHDSRESIRTDDWREAWRIFQERCKEIFNEIENP